MRKKIPFVLSILILIAIVTIATRSNKEESAEVSTLSSAELSKAPAKVSEATQRDLEFYDKHIDTPVKEAPAEMPTLTKSKREDAEGTAALIDIISRHPFETRRLIEENQWVKRREIVEREQSFRDVAKRIMGGDLVESFEVPLFDGETATFLINHDQTTILSENSGAIHGSIEGHPEAFAVVSYYRDADSGLISFPKQNFAVQYEGWGEGRVIVKDYDAGAQSRALPCAHCRLEGSSGNHANHGAQPE